jgi:hypothetical protein
VTVYLNLDLNHIRVDPELIARVPYGLATYYQALPLAQEGNLVSVVMAYPDNKAALAVLSRLLKANVVPVRGSAEAILSAIGRLHPNEVIPEQKILAWSADPGVAAAVTSLANTFSKLPGKALTVLSSNSLHLNTVLASARTGQYNLAVINPPKGYPLIELLKSSATPLVLVRSNYYPLRRSLIVLRGYSSDDQVLDWIVPLASQPGGTVCVMPLTEAPTRSLADLLRANGLAKQHVEGCVRRLEAKGIQPSLKFRQGHPVSQVADELEQGEYDLLVIAAEGQGDFVARVLTEIEQRGVHKERPVFILKPPFIN